MLLLAEAVFVAELVLLVYCVFAIVKTPAQQVRLLPKAAWLLLVVLLPLVGGLGWLMLGRPPTARSAPAPARPVAPAPDDDEAFLRTLHERVEAQREAARQREERERQDQERRGRREGPAPTSEGTGA